MGKKEGRKNRLIGLGFLLFSLITYFLVIPWQVYVPSRTKGTVLSPAFFPKIILGVLALLSFFLIIAPSKERISLFEGEKEGREGNLDFFRIGVIILLFVIYAFMLIPICGFLPASMVFLILLMRYAGMQDWKKIISVSIGIPIIFFYIFKLWAGIVFPKGIFFR